MHDVYMKIIVGDFFNATHSLNKFVGFLSTGIDVCKSSFALNI